MAKNTAAAAQNNENFKSANVTDIVAVEKTAETVTDKTAETVTDKTAETVTDKTAEGFTPIAPSKQVTVETLASDILAAEAVLADKLAAVKLAAASEDGDVMAAIEAVQTAKTTLSLLQANHRNAKLAQERADKIAAEKAKITLIADLARAESTSDNLAEAKAATMAAIETVIGMVFGKAAPSQPRVTVQGEKPTGRRSIVGAVAQAIIADYDKFVGQGMSDTDARKACIAAGHAEGTTGATVRELLLQRAGK